MTARTAHDFLDVHLNVYWLRPESALWDAIASAVISRAEFLSPSVDVGAGNGIFSFITAGGAFSLGYDWYRNVDPTGFWQNKDIYDTFERSPDRSSIEKPPDYKIDYAVDAKESLLRQAAGLDFYRETRLADADKRWPFEDGSVRTIFSNILYWLQSADHSLREIHRILQHGGRALLCLQDHRFKDHCISYRWREKNSELLRLLNRGRTESSYWTTSYDEFSALARRIGFRVADHAAYLSPLTLRAWDIGLRPLSPVLIKMVKLLSETDRDAIKIEWMDTCRPFLNELLTIDSESSEQGGYHFFTLEKI
jgi:SAM-dependent methyltransferase